MTDLAQTLARLSALLGPPTGDPAPLGGGIMNRNYKVELGGTAYVVREPGENTDVLGIDRDAEWSAACAAARAGVGPAVEAMLEDPHVLVTAFVGGRRVTAADLERSDVLGSVAAALRRMHDSGEALRSAFSPFAAIDAYAATVHARGLDPPEGYDTARRRARAVAKVMRGANHDPVPCHNDLVAANLLLEGPVVRLVDWEYAGMGDRYFDLGNLAANNGLSDHAQAVLLEAYFGEDPSPRRLACVQLMGFVSDLREAIWGTLQTAVSRLDYDFADYSSRHMRRALEAADDRRFDGWLRDARGGRLGRARD